MHVLNVNYTTPEAPKLFCQSLKDTGFAVLNNHPISPNLINQVYQNWKDFFSSEEKNNYLFRREEQDGYFPYRSETAKGVKTSDLKEFFHIYPWGRIPEASKEISLELFYVLNGLAAELLQWIEDYLPIDVSKKLSIPLKQMIDNSSKTLLRVLHYPPLLESVERNAVRAAAHEDINLITLLPAATAPGLEVLDVHGNWHTVECNPGNIVVNVGDMLQMCTDFYYKSTTHRVRNPDENIENNSRFSMPLFLHPRGDVKLSEKCTALEYLHERLREIGIY